MWLLRSDRNSRKADSLLVSYVLVIIIAVAISILVYVYLTKQVPLDVAECPEGIDLIVERAECNIQSGRLTVYLKNNGLFNISGAYVRFGESGRKTRVLLNKEGNFPRGVQFSNPLAPDAIALGDYFVSPYLTEGDDYLLEVQPAIHEDNRLVACESVIAQPIKCV